MKPESAIGNGESTAGDTAVVLHVLTAAEYSPKSGMSGLPIPDCRLPSP